MKPVLQALVLADRVYEDKTSGKKVIAGTFSRLVVMHREKPEPSPSGAPPVVTIPVGGMQAGSPFAYISVTDVHGDTKLVLRYARLRDTEHEIMFQTDIAVKCDDPLRTVEVVVPLPALPGNKGVYALEVLYGDELLGANRVVVDEVKG